MRFAYITRKNNQKPTPKIGSAFLLTKFCPKFYFLTFKTSFRTFFAFSGKKLFGFPKKNTVFRRFVLFNGQLLSYNIRGKEDTTKRSIKR